MLIKNVTISLRADNWYISFKYDLEPAPNSPVKKRAVIGVDVGINTLATCSDGTTYAFHVRDSGNVKAYRQAKKRLVRHQRAVSKKVIGSKNRIKAVKRLAKAHKKVADIRADTLHKITTWLAKNHSTIVIEDLNISGMLKKRSFAEHSVGWDGEVSSLASNRPRDHKLASAIADCGFYEFKRQLTYKCEWYGSELVIADRFYPSSQICSHMFSLWASTENVFKHENLQMRTLWFHCSERF